MAAKKICIGYESDCSGETRATESLINELTKNKHLKIYSYAAKPLSKTSFVSFYWWNIHSIWIWLKFIHLHGNVDWIYTTTYVAAIPAVLLSFFYRYQICFHFHNTRIPEKPNIFSISNLSQWLKYSLVKLLHWLFLFKTKIVFVPSQSAQNYLMTNFPRINRDKINIVPNGVDRHIFHPISLNSRKRLLKQYDLGSSKTLTYIGRLDPVKGVEKLILVCESLSSTMPDLRLIFAHPALTHAAEIKYKAQLLDTIRRKKMEDRVIWVNNPKHIQDIYHISQLVVSLSELDYFPLTLLEALSCATLYASTGVGVSKKILEQLSSDLVISSKSLTAITHQIKTILALPTTQRGKLTNKGNQLARKYTWSKSASLLLHHLIYPIENL